MYREKKKEGRRIEVHGICTRSRRAHAKQQERNAGFDATRNSRLGRGDAIVAWSVVLMRSYE